MKTTKIILRTLAILFAFIATTRFAQAQDTWTGSGTNNTWSTAANWLSGTAPSPGDALIFTGVKRVINTNDFTAGTLFNGITFNSPAGIFLLKGTNATGNSIALTSDVVDNQVVVQETIGLPLILNNSINLNVVTSGALLITNVISGANGITVLGGGQATLSGINTFTGPVAIDTNSQLTILSDASLGAVPGALTPGYLVINDGTLLTTNTFAINTNRGVFLGPTTGSGGGTINVNNGGGTVAQTLTYNGIIANNGAGTGGLTKIGFGGLTLSGANTYTGPTIVANGTLTLNFTNATSPTNNMINTNSSLTLGGATAGQGTVNNTSFILNPKAGVTNSQSFAGTLVDKGPATIQLNSNALSGANLALGSLTHNAGGVAFFVPPTLRGGRGNITTTSTNINGILGGWAMISDGTVSGQGWTQGTNWASVDANNNIVNYTNFTVYTTDYVKNFMFVTNNLRIPSTITGDLTNDVDGAGTTNDINTIMVDRTDSGWTFMVGSNNTLRLGKSGGLLRRTYGTSITLNFGGGGSAKITAGGPNTDTPGDIVLTSYQTDNANNNLAINSSIVDNGAGAVTVVKAGSGYAALSASNTYSGGTYILGGRLRWNAPGCFSTGPITIFPGGTTYLNSSAIVTNAMFISGSGTPQEPSIGAIRYGPNPGFFTGPITLIGDAEIGGQGGGGILGPISGAFKLTLCALSTVNGDTMLANTNNSWTGDTIITARNNTGANTLTSSNSEVIPNGFGSGNVSMQGFGAGTITWNLHGFNETINGLSTIGTASTCFIQNGVASTTSTLTVGDNDQSGTFGGSISDGAGSLGLTKIGGGIESFTGNFAITGPVNVNGGTLALSGGGISESTLTINVSTNATLDASAVSGGLSAQSIVVDSGTLISRGVSVVINNLSLTNSHLVTTLNPNVINITASSFSVGGTTNIIDLAGIQSVVSYPTQFTVIQYNGDSISGPPGGFNFGLGTVPTPTTAGFVSNNVANNSVDIVLTGGPLLINWTGSVNTNWDIASSLNWSNATVATQYHDQDSANIDDTASKFLVDLTTTLTPAAVTVNNSTHGYTFGGIGKITGSSSLIKLGTGSLLLTNGTAAANDDYTGGIVVDNGGTLIFGSTNSIQGGINIRNFSTVIVTNLGILAAGVINNEGVLFFNATNNVVANNNITGDSQGVVIKTNTDIVTLGGASSYQALTIVQQGTLRAGSSTAFGGAGAGLNPNTVLTVTNDATKGVSSTLDVGGQTLQTATIGPSTILVNGAGVGGAGAIVNSGALNDNGTLNVTLAGDTTFGGSNRWDIRTITGNVGQLTTLIDSGQDTVNPPYTLTKVGTNQISLVGITVGNGVGNIIVSQGTLGIETTTTPTVGENLTHNITVMPGAALEFFNDSVVPVTIPPVGQPGVGLSKPLVLNGDATGTNFTIWNNSGTNTFNTTINLNSGTNVFFVGGTSLTLDDDGSGNDTLFGAGTLLKSGGSPLFINIPLNYTGNTIVSNGFLYVDAPQTNSTTVNTVIGGTLAGEGWFAGTVIMTGGALSPGDTNLTAGAPDLRNFVISNSLSLLGGTLVMDMNRSGGVFTGDFITNETALTIGGTLQLNLTGEPLALGDAIPIFSTNGITPVGSFSGFVPSRPGVGLGWNQSTIAGDGKIRLQVAPTTPPVITGFSLSSRTNVVISATNGSQNATIKLLTSTNVATKLANWTSVGTGQFNNGGNLSFTFTNAAVSTNAQQFYLLQEQ